MYISFILFYQKSTNNHRVVPQVLSSKYKESARKRWGGDSLDRGRPKVLQPAPSYLMKLVKSRISP